MRVKHGLAAFTLLGTAGCATFDGMPQPVFPADATVARITAAYPLDTVVQSMAGQDGDARKIYRNRVAAAYLMAIDARYFAFRRGLSRNMKGGSLGFDLVLLGLTGSAAIWEQAADELAAAATGIAGARASVNRELYFERALPALISLMEAQRLDIRTAILRGLRESEDEYTVQELFADLARYEGAASIDGAIQKASEIAGQQSAQAQINFSRAIELCEAPDEVADARRIYFQQLETGRSTDAGRQRYARAAVIAGVSGAQPSEDETVHLQQQQAVADYLRGICTQQTLDLFKQQVDPPAAGANGNGAGGA
jgi:hypothetical protein